MKKNQHLVFYNDGPTGYILESIGIGQKKYNCVVLVRKVTKKVFG